MFAMPTVSYGYKSAVETVNNNEVLTLHYYKENIGSYTFFVTNSTYDQMINGKIQFNKSDEKRARKILDNLLKSLKFQ